jgi:hypothetical protein
MTKTNQNKAEKAQGKTPVAKPANKAQSHDKQQIQPTDNADGEDSTQPPLPPDPTQDPNLGGGVQDNGEPNEDDSIPSTDEKANDVAPFIIEVSEVMVNKIPMLRFTHPDGRRLQWKLHKNGKVIVKTGREITPSSITTQEKVDALLSFVDSAPMYFQEIFE